MKPQPKNYPLFRGVTTISQDGKLFPSNQIRVCHSCGKILNVNASYLVEHGTIYCDEECLKRKKGCGSCG